MDTLIKSRWRLACFLFALVFLAYYSTLSAPLVFDDSHTISNNAAVKNPANVFLVWTSPKYYASTPDHWMYRPFTTFANWMCWQMGNGQPWAFHLLKTVLHSAVCLFLVMMWRVLWSLPGFFHGQQADFASEKTAQTRKMWLPESAAVFLGVTFAIHPANSQVVNYVSATSSLLCGTFFILAYVLYLKWRVSSRNVLLFLAVLSYFLAILAKEEGITLPALIILTELFWPKKLDRRRLVLLVMSFLLTLSVAAVLLVSQFESNAQVSMGSISRWTYFMTQWRGYLYYLRLVVLPFGMSIDNLEFGFSTSLRDPWLLLALSANLIMVWAAWRFRRRHPALLFGLVWFYIAISPASSVMPLAEPVNDHRMYLAYFGIFGAIFPYFLKALRFFSQRVFSDPSTSVDKFQIKLLVLLFGLLFALTQVRNQVWRSNESLWIDTLNKNPSSARARNNLALSYLAQQRWGEARKILMECDRLNPSYSTCQVNLGVVAMNLGEDTEAETRFLNALKLDLEGTPSRLFLAGFYFNRGSYTKALGLYREITQATAKTNLESAVGEILSLQKLGQITEASLRKSEAAKRFGSVSPLLNSHEL